VAQIRIDTRTGHPYCPGCHAEMPVLHWFLDSSVRGEPYGLRNARRGTSARAVQVFAAEHAACPERREVREVTASGMPVTDRRGAR
jgi:hypothetical protein